MNFNQTLESGETVFENNMRNNGYKVSGKTGWNQVVGRCRIVRIEGELQNLPMQQIEKIGKVYDYRTTNTQNVEVCIPLDRKGEVLADEQAKKNMKCFSVVTHEEREG